MARKAKEIIFFDNYDSNYHEYARENLEENGIENPSESQIWEEASNLELEDFETACEEIDEILSTYVLVIGYCGRWDRNYDGGAKFFIIKVLRIFYIKFPEIASISNSR